MTEVTTDVTTRIDRSFIGMRDALFDAWDAIRSKKADLREVEAIAKLSAQISTVVNVELKTMNVLKNRRQDVKNPRNRTWKKRRFSNLAQTKNPKWSFLSHVVRHCDSAPRDTLRGSPASMGISLCAPLHVDIAYHVIVNTDSDSGTNIKRLPMKNAENSAMSMGRPYAHTSESGPLSIGMHAPRHIESGTLNIGRPSTSTLESSMLNIRKPPAKDAKRHGRRVNGHPAMTS